MKLKVIKNKREHAEALKAMESLWNSKPGTPQGEKLELLAALVDAYEEKAYAILPPDPIEAIKFRMQQEDMKKSDLAKILGGRNRASEVLSGKRGLSLEMIRNLHKKLHIPVESLLAIG